jgi:hypothetical protein
MSQPQTTSRLTDVLDILWHASDPRLRELATRLLPTLTDNNRLVLLAWDTAASFGPLGGRVDILAPRSFAVLDGWGKLLFSADLAKSTQGHHIGPMLSYTDMPWAVFRKSGDYAPTDTPRHSGASLLIAMQLIRDHIDSTILKPAEMRHRELDGFAQQAGVDADHFRRLTTWFPRIQDLV